MLNKNTVLSALLAAGIGTMGLSSALAAVSAEEAKCDKVLKYCTATLEKAAEKHGLAKDFYALKHSASHSTVTQT